MRLKSFYAKTMTEAMQMVRDTLGEDAVIVATREEKGGKAVRVTAAIDPAFEVGRAGAVASADDWLQYDSEDEESAVAEELTDAMLRHSVPEDVMDQVISCATIVGLEQPGAALVAAIEHLFNFRPLPQKPSAKAQIFAGPPGGGKTLAVAKLAARGTMAGLKIGVITCDTVRAGGVEQLQAFTKLLKIPLQKSESPQDLRYILGDMADEYDQVLVDTAALNPFDKDDVKTLARIMGAGNAEGHLVLPAGGDSDETGEMARIFATLGIHSLIPTRLDMARRLGGILSAAHMGGLTFSDASNTPKVADGLLPLDPQTLSRLLMPAAFKTQRQGQKTPSAPYKRTRQ